MIITIQPGDTLSEISQKYTGDASKHDQFTFVHREGWRPWWRNNNHVIYPGDVFLIPDELLLEPPQLDATETFTKIILDLVNTASFINGPALVSQALHLYYKNNSEKFGHVILDVPELIENLVKTKQLVEVEYRLPTMNYRVKSLYFPANTEVEVPHKP